MSARPRRESKAPSRLANNQARNMEEAAARAAARPRTKKTKPSRLKKTYNHKTIRNWHLKMHNPVF
jgi:hypothetical protein